MNVQAMLADFLDLVTPKYFNKHMLNSLTASLQSLLINGQCSVTAIGRGIDSESSERHCIKRADRLLSHDTMQDAVPEFYTAMTGALVKGKQPLILIDWSNAHRTKKKGRLEVLLLLAALAHWLHYMLGVAVELAGKHLSKQTR